MSRGRKVGVLAISHIAAASSPVTPDRHAATRIRVGAGVRVPVVWPRTARETHRPRTSDKALAGDGIVSRNESTMSTPAAAAESGARRIRAALPLVALAAFTVALAVAGVLVATNTLSSTAEDVSHEAAPSNIAVEQTFATGQPIPTSFGAVTLYPMGRMPGLTSEQLGGMVHGVQNLVTPDKAQIEVAIALTNNTGEAVTYSPRQFLLRTESGGPGTPPTTASASDGQLQSGASVTATLGFVLPQDGSTYWLEFSDPGRSQPIVVDLGKTDSAPAGSQDQQHH